MCNILLCFSDLRIEKHGAESSHRLKFLRSFSAVFFPLRQMPHGLSTRAPNLRHKIHKSAPQRFRCQFSRISKPPEQVTHERPFILQDSNRHRLSTHCVTHQFAPHLNKLEYTPTPEINLNSHARGYEFCIVSPVVYPFVVRVYGAFCFCSHPAPPGLVLDL
jgi:hypothetical protein